MNIRMFAKKKKKKKKKETNKNKINGVKKRKVFLLRWVLLGHLIRRRAGQWRSTASECRDKGHLQRRGQKSGSVSLEIPSPGPPHSIQLQWSNSSA
jgi:hypothetical protein